MMTAADKHALRNAVDRLAAQLPAYAVRREQLRLMAAVGDTVVSVGDQRAGALVAHAETGVGKSFGLLLPSIVLGRMRGLKVIVSSSTTLLRMRPAKSS